jgi:hypothetical protein
MWSLLTAVETSDELLKPERNHSLYVTYSVPSIPSISIRFRGQSAGSQRQGDIFCLSFGLRVPWAFVHAVHPRPSGGCAVPGQSLVASIRLH